MSTVHARQSDVMIPAGTTELSGELTLPEPARGLVIFAHGSGSGRFSPRNQFVARQLQTEGWGTLLLDLLTEGEEARELYTRHLRFDLPLLAGRLVAATRWALDEGVTRGLRVGFLGASTGAAAALLAATMLGEGIGAVVSRSGRPDLAAAILQQVRAPTLLIVGGRDLPVLPLNQEAFDRLGCEKAMEIVPDASHLFEEPGALEHMAHSAATWFQCHLPPDHAARAPFFPLPRSEAEADRGSRPQA